MGGNLADLNGARVGAEQDFGGDPEAVLHVGGWMIGGKCELGEVVVLGVDFGAGRRDEAEIAKDGEQVVADLGDGVDVSPTELQPAGKGEVEGASL